MHILIRISLILKAGVAKNPVLELKNGVTPFINSKTGFFAALSLIT